MSKTKGLGRGLDALLGGEEKSGDRLTELPIGQLQPGKYQPRMQMKAEALAELAASIKAQGLMQPLLVRPVGSNRYELIAGERRWRAAQQAGLTAVPVLIREVPDTSAAAMALIENIQREDLNAMEQASGIARLIDEFRMTHEQAADAVGRSRSATSNLLRLLKLAKPVQNMVMEGTLEMGHARALLALDTTRQIEVAHQVLAKRLSVRETEALVGRTLRGRPSSARKARVDRDLARLEEEVSERIGTTVQIKPGKKGAGSVIVQYASLDHLDDILARLKR